MSKPIYHQYIATNEMAFFLTKPLDSSVDPMEVYRSILQYITQNKLVTNRYNYILDDTLSPLFKENNTVLNVNYFNLSKLLKKHFTKHYEG